MTWPRTETEPCQTGRTMWKWKVHKIYCPDWSAKEASRDIWVWLNRSSIPLDPLLHGHRPTNRPPPNDCLGMGLRWWYFWVEFHKELLANATRRSHSSGCRLYSSFKNAVCDGIHCCWLRMVLLKRVNFEHTTLAAVELMNEWIEADRNQKVSESN